ncbi:tRNA wybutosine-synthesizing protein 5-like [Oopsacas minuta]|uniref:tRNA wybutosine-synthesizing protein 5-like n=1 Tax=Oopsacas minuta TaxID=111878 RepID=A0AAV7KDL4_9METZ|nr:tRNA wybutosine-synthesizing protein 5-like [Oopsacas minuta]
MASNTTPTEIHQQVKLVSRYQYTNELELTEFLQTTRLPHLIQGFDIGPCKELWTSEYLHSVCSSNLVSVMVSLQPLLEFAPKNYEYKSMPLNELCKLCGISHDLESASKMKEYYYLRSLGENPFKDVADFYKQLPELSKDILIPKVFTEEQYFSSVLRIASAGIQLFTHYDIMDNILVQIRGRKRIALFSPRDSNNLYLQKEKSPIVDIDNPDWDKFPKFSNAIRWDCILNPGDMLYIPAPWLHNVKNLDFTVAINFFWKNLDKSMYATNDVFGNKDLIPAQRAKQILSRALKALDELPPEFKEFYGRNMIGIIEEKTFQ